MLTIAVLNQKAGRKSTSLDQPRAAAQPRKRRVLVVDLDSQGSAFDWYARVPRTSSSRACPS